MPPPCIRSNETYHSNAVLTKHYECHQWGFMIPSISSPVCMALSDQMVRALIRGCVDQTKLVAIILMSPENINVSTGQYSSQVRPWGEEGVNQLSWEIGDENSSWPPKVFRLNRISWTFLGFLSPISQVSPLFLLHSYYSSHFATYGKVKPKISARIYVYDFFALPVCAHEKLRKKTGILDWGGGVGKNWICGQNIGQWMLHSWT